MPHEGKNPTTAVRGRAPGRRCAVLLAALAAVLPGCGGDLPEDRGPPPRLFDTGLYADPAARRIADGVLAYVPQYPLWTDGAGKQRWIRLPPGAVVDARDPDAFRFPIGTRFWKEFAFDGRPAETRFMELRAGGRWLYATYVWNAEGSDAVLAPDRGVQDVCPTEGGAHHDVPSAFDCRACHEAGPTAVLGFSALQLSDDGDPLAPHSEARGPDALGLRALIDAGLVVGLPEAFRTEPPRIDARSPRERAALGYLHANCGSCHTPDGPLHTLGMSLRHSLTAAHDLPAAITTTVGQRSRYVPPGAAPEPLRIAPGAPHDSVLLARLRSRDPLQQMPPLGTHLVDDPAVALVEAWIREDLARFTHLAESHPSRTPR